jgi:hypothetical protein
MKEKSFLIYMRRHLWNARVALEGADTTSYIERASVKSKVNIGLRSVGDITGPVGTSTGAVSNLLSKQDLCCFVNGN